MFAWVLTGAWNNRKKSPKIEAVNVVKTKETFHIKFYSRSCVSLQRTAITDKLCGEYDFHIWTVNGVILVTINRNGLMSHILYRI